MATVTIRPNSDIEQYNATKSTGSTFYGCVDEATLDTGDYITFSGTGGYATFNWSSAGLTDETINKVTFYAIVEYNASHFVRLMDRFENTTRYFGYFSRVSGNSYEIELTTNPITEEAWTVSDLDDLSFGLDAYNDDLKPVDPILYQFYAVVDYEESAGGDDYTLTCAAGSYSLTGTNADLTVTRHYTLTCSAGSYSLTGTNADLTVKRNYVLACSAGSYSLTGTNTALTSSRTLICEPASGGAYPDIIVSGAGTSEANGTYKYLGDWGGKPLYTSGDNSIWWDYNKWAIINAFESGNRYESTDDVATPDLVTTWTVGGDGSLPVPTVTAAPSLGYILTGSDVTLTYTQGAQSYTLTCEAGSYALTGSDVSFAIQRNYSFECGTGNYTLSGTNATFEVKRNYTLVCEPGSYTLTGTDITFGNSKAYSLTCEAGAYTLTGSNVSFVIQRNYSLACEAGSYTLTGTDANLVLLRNYILACEAGGYALTGTNAGLTSARTMALESGSYALTGTNADLYRTLVMACEAGSYALTGTDASLTSHRIFALGMGSYVLVGTSVGLFILSPTPACRTATIEYENRTFAIPHENRTATIEFENRTLEVTCH